jgi:hypothetical protein
MPVPGGTAGLTMIQKKLLSLRPKAIKATPLFARYFSTVLNFLLIKYFLVAGEPALAASLAIYASYFDAVAMADFGNRNKIIADQKARLHVPVSWLLLAVTYVIVVAINPGNASMATPWFVAYGMLYVFILESYRLLYRRAYLAYSIPSVLIQTLIFLLVVSSGEHGLMEQCPDVVLIAWTLLPVALPGLLFAFNKELSTKIVMIPSRHDLINSVSSALLYLSSYFAISYAYSWIKDAHQVVLLSVALRILNVTGIYALWTQVHVVDFKGAESKWRRLAVSSLLPGIVQTLLSLVVYVLVVKFAFPELEAELLSMAAIVTGAVYVFSRNASAVINAMLLAGDKVRLFLIIEGAATTIIMLARQFMDADFIHSFASIAAFQVTFVMLYVAYLIGFGCKDR